MTVRDVHTTQPGTVHFGVGLNNTRTRLEQMYGNEQSLTIRQPEIGGFEVEILIPYHLAPELSRKQNHW